MRKARQRAILEIVDERAIHNQAELVAALEDRGLDATQATVSRDVRALGLVKVPVAGGGARYARPGSAPEVDDPTEQLRDVAGFVLGLDEGGGLLLVKTPSGHANAVAVAIDGCRFPEVAGTIAGDDTILVVTRKAADRGRLRRRIERLVG